MKFILDHLKVAVGLSVVVIALLSITAAAFADTNASHAADVIHACVNIKSHGVIIVDGPEHCRPAEEHITWNMHGPEGPQGPQGPAGPPGVSFAGLGCPTDEFLTGFSSDGELICTPLPGAIPSPGPGDSPPIPTTPDDAAIVAVQYIGDQNGRNQEASPELVHHWGIAETLFLRAEDDTPTPWLASAFTLRPDLSGAEIHIRSGVEFSHGYGELTAEDVAWSMNDANAATNPSSFHGQAGDFAALWSEWRVVDDTTVEFDFNSFDATWAGDFLNQSGQSFSVFSKRAFQENGPDFVRDNIIATGPFLIESWDSNNQVTLVSRYSDGGQHHMADLTPKTDRVQFIEVSDEGTRAVLLRSGRIDATHLRPSESVVTGLAGFGQTGTQNVTQLGIFFAGNLWEDVNAQNGADLPAKSTFVHDHAWIGSPGRHNGGLPADDMEQARLIRRALAIAYDRDQINDELFSGLGSPVHVPYFSTSHPNWGSQWEYPFDPDEARRILTEDVAADYQQGSADTSHENLGGNAFEIAIYAGPELGGGNNITGQIADEVAESWEQLGLTVFVLKYQYPIFRPTVVSRASVMPWITSCDRGQESYPWHFTKGLVQTTLTRGGFSCGFESPEILELYFRMQDPEIAEATQAATEYLDYVYYWNLQPGVVAVPDDVFFNPHKIAGWSMAKSFSSSIDSLWNLELK